MTCTSDEQPGDRVAWARVTLANEADARRVAREHLHAYLRANRFAHANTDRARKAALLAAWAAGVDFRAAQLELGVEDDALLGLVLDADVAGEAWRGARDEDPTERGAPE